MWLAALNLGHSLVSFKTSGSCEIIPQILDFQKELRVHLGAEGLQSESLYEYVSVFYITKYG